MNAINTQATAFLYLSRLLYLSQSHHYTDHGDEDDADDVTSNYYVERI